jgi:hypothetical protein
VADELDELFAAPLDEFTATRNRLAKALRADGRGEEADAVAALRKPSPAVWAVNRLAREERSAVRGLVQAAERLRAIQSGHRRGSFQEAREAFAAEAAGLSERAIGLVGGSGGASADVQRRIRETLTAAASLEELNEPLLAGRLTAEPEPIGFGAIGSVASSAKAAKGDRSKAADSRRERAAEERRRRQRLKTLQAELRATNEEAARLRSDAELVERRAAELERELAALDAKRRS